MPANLSDTAELLRVLGEPTRLRLALLLGQFRLTVAELTELTGLAQSRISSHLARMRRMDLLAEDRRGSASLQSLQSPLPEPAGRLLDILRQQTDPELQLQDSESARALIARRQRRGGWAAGVAGEMEKHYSPGRGWEIITRILLPFIRLGDVLDIAAGDGVVASLLVPRARSITCVELDETVVAAGEKRLGAHANARYLRADMHRMPLEDGQFDTVFLLNALTYSPEPEKVIAEAARCLKPGGQMALSTLDQHEHHASVAMYDHCNNGFTAKQLQDMLRAARLQVADNAVATIEEGRPPFHRVHVVLATRPE